MRVYNTDWRNNRMNYAEESLKRHAQWAGKIEVISKVPVKTTDDLALAYTPGVAQPCLEIQKDPGTTCAP